MLTSDKLRRHAYHLMSLASLGMFFGFFAWLVALLAINRLPPEHLFSPMPALGSLKTWFFDARTQDPALALRWSLALTVPYLFAVLWPLIRLRGLAGSLYRNNPISLEVAGRFRALANALLVGLAVAWLGPISLPHLVGGPKGPMTIDLSTIYLGAIALLCLYSVALILGEAARIADENREFV